MRHLICAGFAAIMLGGCITDPETEKTYSLSLPLNVGNKWEYESTEIRIKPNLKKDTIRDSNHIFLSVTDMQTSQAGFPVFEFKDSSSGMISYDYYEKKNDGLYLYASTPGGNHTLWKSSLLRPEVVQKEPPVLYTPLSFKIGDEWVYDSSISDQEKIALKRIFLGIEKVVTKAGTFDCYKFETTGYIKEKRYHYFYPLIGLVKKEVVDSMAIVDANFNFVEYQIWITQKLLVSAN